MKNKTRTNEGPISSQDTSSRTTGSSSRLTLGRLDPSRIGFCDLAAEHKRKRCEIIKREGDPGTDGNGKCMGFGRSEEDDEPCQPCKRCKHCTSTKRRREMSKSILVIDTPGDCESCPFCRGLNVCKIMKYLKREKLVSQYTVDHQIYVGEKPDWCPLKNVPEKKNVRGFCLGEGDFEQKGYQQGWNACIDEILKGANGNE